MEENWEGSERREAKRRYTVDRRLYEKRKRAFVNFILPSVIGVVVAGLVSWGAYVTHTTYSISAKFEETFKSHIEEAAKDSIATTLRMDSIVNDYNDKLVSLHEDMNEGFRELRESQRNIFNLLLQHDIGNEKSKDNAKD